MLINIGTTQAVNSPKYLTEFSIVKAHHCTVLGSRVNYHKKWTEFSIFKAPLTLYLKKKITDIDDKF